MSFTYPPTKKMIISIYTYGCTQYIYSTVLNNTLINDYQHLKLYNIEIPGYVYLNRNTSRLGLSKQNEPFPTFLILFRD